MTLAEFLTARLDEDEATAKSAMEAGRHLPWEAEYCEPLAGGACRYTITSGVTIVAYALSMTADSAVRHIVLHDPARALREVEAGRQLLTAYEDQESWLADVDDPDTAPASPEWTRGARDALFVALKLRAAPYSDHPDFRAEWA